MKLCGENFLSLFKKILLDKENKKLDELFFILVIQKDRKSWYFQPYFCQEKFLFPPTPKLCYYVLVSVIAVKLHRISKQNYLHFTPRPFTK